MFAFLRWPLLSIPQATAAMGLMHALRLLTRSRRAERPIRLDDLNDHLLRDIGLERPAGPPVRMGDPGWR